MHTETEVKFLEVDVPTLTAKLTKLGAINLGEELLRETIFYDQAGEWLLEKSQKANQSRLIRLRQNSKNSKLAYKCHYQNNPVADEIELEVTDPEAAVELLTTIGYPAYRTQEQKQHQFKLDGCDIDFKTWPNVPTYVELEGSSMKALAALAEKLGLDWGKHISLDSGSVLKDIYQIPIFDLKYFTFQKSE